MTSYSFVHNGKTYSAEQTPEGTYLCPCPSHRGIDQLYPYDALKNHIKAWKAAYDAEFKPHQEKLEPISPDLYDTSTLRSLGLCINIKVSLLICIACGLALVPSQAASHLSQKHSLKCADLSRILGPLTLGSSLPPTLTGPIPPVSGLPVVSAFKCTECGYILGSEKNIKQHFVDRHPHSTQLERYAAVSAQHLNNFQSKTYFEVAAPIIHTTPLTIDDYITKISQDMALAQSRIPAEPDARNVPDWLKRTRWHEHVARFSPRIIRRLVSFPTIAEFPTLKKYVSQLLHECCALISVTPVLILQKLNSPDIAKEGVNNKPFSLHQEYETTMASYACPIISLVAMLLRRTDEYEIRLSAEIEGKVTRVRDALDEDEETGKLAIFDLLLSLWTTEWEPAVPNTIVDPTVHSLVLSCLRDDGTFLEPVLFTNIIARLEYGMRSIFLRAIHEDGRVSIAAKKLERWYQEKVESPFNTLRNLQHDLSTVAFNTLSLPRVVWTDDQTHQHLRYRGAPIALSSITTMFSEMETDAAKLWEDRVLLGLGLYTKYDQIYDDMTNTTTGYSFLTDHRNSAFHDRHMLMKAIYENPALRAEFILSRAEQSICWNIPRLRVWLADYARFQRLELILAHCTAGSPSRGTEITAMLYSNTASSLGRNVAFVADTLTLLCTYQKTSSMRGQSKLIPHALSGFLGDLLLQDLAIARPFAEFVAHIVFTESIQVLGLYRRHLFVNNGELFTTPDMTAALEEYTLTWLGEKLGVNGLRHIFTAFRRKLCNRMEELFAEDNMDSIGAIQMGHSRSTENRVYGLEENGLGGAPEDLLRLFLEASSDWQVVVKLVPGGLKLRYRDAMSVHFQALVDAQRIRPRRIAQSEIYTVIESMFDKMWQRISHKLDTVGSLSSSQTSHTLASSDDITPDLVHSYTAVDQRTLEEQALATLRLLVKDPVAEWNLPEQRTAVLTMLQRKQDLVALLPTGSGKSMVALIPALMEPDSVTVLVCPLRSLMMDYERRFSNFGVAYEVYNDGPLRSLPSLVLVSADSVKLKDWCHHLSNLHDQKRVARFIFDEAHIPIMDVSYRHSLANMYEMRSFLPVQIGLLSASVPTHAEACLKTTFGVGHNHVFLRASSNRPELQYIWKSPLPHGDYISAVVKMAHEYTFSHHDDRGLIYVTSSEVGRTISDRLDIPFYTSHESVSLSDKQAMYNSWHRGETRFMVCTTAFGAGNDYPRVRVVIHAGTPYELVPYIQETGRAGRDGEPALCIMFQSSMRMARVDQSSDLSGAQAMLDALRSPDCIRSQLTSFVDGKPQRCRDDSSNQLCSICSQPPSSKRPPPPFSEEAEQAKRRKITRQLTETEYGTKLKSALVFWSRHCIFCQVMDDTVCPSHSIIFCPTLSTLLDGEDSVRQYRDFKALICYSKSVDFPTLSMCYKCAVPRGMSVSVHPQRFGSDGATCEYPDIITPLAWAVFNRHDLRLSAGQHFGCKFSNPRVLAQWLAQANPPHPSNALALFLWYHDFYAKLV